MTNLWARLNNLLDDDERIITPEMYYDHLRLYNGIREIAYLVKYVDHPEIGMDWVKESSLGRAEQMFGPFSFMKKVYIVQLRLPWNLPDNECLVSPQEFNQNRHLYIINDVYLRVKKLDEGKILVLVNAVDFEENRENYEVVELRYSVIPITNPKDPKPPLHIDKNHYNAVLAL